MVFEYRENCPFEMLRCLAAYGMEELDSFLQLAETAADRRRRELRDNATDDSWEWVYDEYTQMERVPQLASELAVVGLWSVVEDFRRRSLIQCEVHGAMRAAFSKEKVTKMLASLRIIETNVRCARTVDELRCLNNAVKHGGKVDTKLGAFVRWKQGERLVDLGPHYRRLKPAAEKYIADLARRLAVRWRSLPNTDKPPRRQGAGATDSGRPAR